MGLRVIYLDTLFFLNLSADYFLLLLTAKVAGLYPRRRRLLAGALVGAILAVLLYFPPVPVFLAAALRLGTCLAVVLSAFGSQPGWRLARLCGIFTLMTLVLAGIVLALAQTTGRSFLQNGVFYFDISGAVMLISFTAIYALSGLVLGKGRAELGRSYREVTAVMGSRTLKFRALTDSGNLLRDPISGRRVIVVQAATAAALFDPFAADLLQDLTENPLETLLTQLRQQCGTPFWLLPANTAAQSCLLLAFRPEKLYIDGRLRDDHLLGLTAQPLEIGGDCRALMGV